MIASGHLYLPAQSKAYQSHLERLEDSALIIRSVDLAEELTFSADEYQLEDYLQGLPQQIRFSDGSLFVADQASTPMLDGWFAASRSDRSLTWWESHWLPLVLALLLTPAIIWWIMVQGIPMAAHASVRFLPAFVAQKMGDQTLTLLDEYELTPSALPPDQIEAIADNWQTALANLDLPTSEYKLLFRQSELFNANAFALPNNTIVITDSLIHLLENQPDPILAILLHETGIH